MAPRVAANARRRPGARAVKTKDVPADEDEEFWGQAAFGSESEDDSFDEDAHSDKGEVGLFEGFGLFLSFMYFVPRIRCANVFSCC